MTKQMIKIHNVSTGEVIEREMNAEELAQLEINKLANDAIKAEDAKAAADKAALLAKLGITTDDLKALGL
jgi:hypothetical protein